MRDFKGDLSEPRSSGEIECHPSDRPASSSSKAKAHSPFRIVQSGRWNCGRGYSGRGGLPTAGPVSPLPAMVDLRTNPLVVDLTDALHRLLGERGHLGGGEVVLDLLGAFGAGDGAGDGRVHQDPAQRQLREGITLGYATFELLGGPEAGLEVHPGEGLPLIES